MELNEAYQLLGVDSFTSSLIIMFQKEYIYKAMVGFGNYPLLPIWLITFVVSTVGCMINWWFGRILLFCPTVSGHSIEQSQNYIRWQQSINRYGIYCLFLSWIPFFGIAFTLMAGSFKLPILRSLCFILLGRIAYYYYQIYGLPTALEFFS